MIPNAWSGFNFGLGEDADQLRHSVSSFAADRIGPRALSNRRCGLVIAISTLLKCMTTSERSGRGCMRLA